MLPARKHITFLLLSLIILSLTGCGIKARIKRADKKFAIGEYYDAAEIYRQCYGRISAQKEKALKAHVAFRQGECYRILNNTRAVNSYQNAIRNKYADSIVYLRQAQVQQYQAKYKEAEKNYMIYLESHPQDYVAMSGLMACREVDKWKKTPTRYKVALVKELNQKRTSNFAPAYIGMDANAIMFSSNRQQTGGKKKMKRNSPVTGVHTFNLYTTRQDKSGKWEEILLPEGLYGGGDSENENDSTGAKTGQAELGVCCFTADGKTMYLTYSCPVNGQDLGTKIYVSNRAGGEWGEPQEVKLFKDSSITVGHPAINLTGDTLYFVSDAPNGYGGKDIWMVEADGDGWSMPLNLGSRINTSGDEMFPCIHPDGTLYFSSNGHAGYGGLDIFMALRDSIKGEDPVQWSVYNMGQPFNSNGDDFGITFAGNSQNGFFSSNRGQKKGLDQIYSFMLPEMIFTVEGVVTDNNGDKIADAVLRMVGDDGTNTKMQVRRDGTYKVKLNKDVNYIMLATARGYLNQKQEIQTFGLTDSKAYTQNFTLTPISKPVAMDNIFYEFGKWELTPASEQGLQNLVKLLNDNPNITIELSAHTDMVGDDKSNLQLSEKRAQSVVAYLIKSGIEKERLTPVGYGESKPVIADKAIHDKYPFIPQEQELTPEFISTLTKDQQDKCNQINRRTEFKVLKTTYKLW